MTARKHLFPAQQVAEAEFKLECDKVETLTFLSNDNKHKQKRAECD